MTGQHAVGSDALNRARFNGNVERNRSAEKNEEIRRNNRRFGEEIWSRFAGYHCETAFTLDTV